MARIAPTTLVRPAFQRHRGQLGMGVDMLVARCAAGRCAFPVNRSIKEEEENQKSCSVVRSAKACAFQVFSREFALCEFRELKPSPPAHDAVVEDQQLRTAVLICSHSKPGS